VIVQPGDSRPKQNTSRGALRSAARSWNSVGLTGSSGLRAVAVGLWAFASMAIPALMPGPAAAQDMRVELRHLLESHPRLLAARKSLDAASEGVREANSGYLPKVTLRGDVGPEVVDSPSRRSTEQETFSDTSRSSTLTVTQNVFDGYYTDANTRIAELEKQATDQDYLIQEQQLLADGIEAYLNVLKQAAMLEIARLNERTVQEQLQLESARVERGSGLAVDVLQAKSRLQLARERVVTVSGDLREAMSVYSQAFDRPASPAQMTLPPLPAAALPETLESAISIATAENPVLKQSLARIDIASEKRTTAEATYWPRLDLVGEGSWEKDSAGVAGIRREGKVVLRAVWDIFDGFLTPARASKAAIEYGTALDNRLDKDRDVRDKVRRAWERYRTTADQRDLLSNAVNIASEVFEARKKLRNAGKESAINVLDAESELSHARLRFSSAIHDHQIAAYRVLLQIGRLTPETLSLTK
jgi:adhesin transport system outer membrane protein